MNDFRVTGVFQAGVLVSDIDECLRLFHDRLGMQIVFDARNQVQTARGLSGVDNQIMNVVMLRGDGGADLEIHQYVSPPGHPQLPMNHNDIGSTHFMLRVEGIENVVKEVASLGYTIMTPIVQNPAHLGFKYVYFRGPDGMMVELQEGDYPKEGKTPRPLDP